MWLLLTAICQIRHTAKQVSSVLCSMTIIQSCGDKVEQHTSQIPEPGSGREVILQLLLGFPARSAAEDTDQSQCGPSASAFHDSANRPVCLRRVETLAQLCKRRLKLRVKLGQAKYGFVTVSTCPYTCR